MRSRVSWLKQKQVVWGWRVVAWKVWTSRCCLWLNFGEKMSPVALKDLVVGTAYAWDEHLLSSLGRLITQDTFKWNKMLRLFANVKVRTVAICFPLSTPVYLALALSFWWRVIGSPKIMLMFSTQWDSCILNLHLLVLSTRIGRTSVLVSNSWLLGPTELVFGKNWFSVVEN